MANYNVKYNSNQVNFNSNLYPNPSAPSAPWNGNAPPFTSQQNFQPPPPPYQAAPSNTAFDRSVNEQKYQEIINKYEISHLFSQKLQLLFSFKIVFIFDDSGMNKFFVFLLFIDKNYSKSPETLKFTWT